MEGTEVFGVLKGIRATHVHHANSVTTSCTFLEKGGLASRGFVQDHGLKQTPQPSSDEIDQKYDIWHRVFVDHVDIHDRAGQKKGPNHYGPVLFVLDLDVLLHLPADSEVLVTKKNPVHWQDGEPDGARWFRSAEELAKNIKFGNFDKMLVIQTPSGMLDFPGRSACIILDDPQRKVSSGQDAYTYAEARLKKAAKAGGVQVSVARRTCRDGCTCVEKYATWNAKAFDLCFT